MFCYYKEDDCKLKNEKFEGLVVDMKLVLKVVCKEKFLEKILKDLINFGSMSKGKIVLVILFVNGILKNMLDIIKNRKIVEKGYENMFWVENS